MISISAESQPGTVESKPPGASCVYVEIQQWVTHLLGNPRNVSTLCIYSWRSWCVNGWSDVAVYEVDMASHAMINRDLGGSTRSHLCCKDLGIFVFFLGFLGLVLFLSWCKNPRSVKSQSGELIFLKDRLNSKIIFFPKKQISRKTAEKRSFFHELWFRSFLRSAWGIAADCRGAPEFGEMSKTREASEMSKWPNITEKSYKSQQICYTSCKS